MSNKTFKPRGALQREIVVEITEWDEQPLTWKAVIDRANSYDYALEYREGEGADPEVRPVLRKLRDAAARMAARMVKEGLGPDDRAR